MSRDIVERLSSSTKIIPQQWRIEAVTEIALLRDKIAANAAETADMRESLSLLRVANEFATDRARRAVLAEVVAWHGSKEAQNADLRDKAADPVDAMFYAGKSMAHREADTHFHAQMEDGAK